MSTDFATTNSLPSAPHLPTRRASVWRRPPYRSLATALIAALFLAAPVSQAHAAKVIRQYIADGFDFPVGKPDGYGYYRARGFWPNGHLGEDWNGRGGGNSDLGDPVYAIGSGVVVFSTDYRVGWGNVVIIRHAYRGTDGRVLLIDSLYGHLDRRMVKLYQLVKRGQQIGTIGTNRGMYLAHLHFEIRKNLNIGMARSSFSKTYANYYSPTDFIRQRRKLRTGFRMHPIAVDTFGKGKPDPNKLATTTIPAEKPKRSISSSSRSSRFAATRPPVPPDVEKVLKNNEPAAKSDTKNFWQKIKGRLKFRPTSEVRSESNSNG